MIAPEMIMQKIIMSCLLVVLGAGLAGCGEGEPRSVAPESATLEKPAPKPSDATAALLNPKPQNQAMKIADNIFMAAGFGNTFLIKTSGGTVIIDTSMARSAPAHKALLTAQDARPPSHVIITHAHPDHIGGVPLWMEGNPTVIQHSHAAEFMHYQTRLKGFSARRNAAQFGQTVPPKGVTMGTANNYGATVPASLFVDDTYTLTLGDLDFQIIATPSETPDALSIYIPQRKAVFVGDLYYRSFPNLYTLRGTKPRWALDYVASLNRVMALDAEILIPSHGAPIHGAQAIRDTLTQYRDAILYVHDATVAGMNAGENVEHLARTITLPDALALPELYGTVPWSVRGIYLGYAGWFDGNPSTLFTDDPAPSTEALLTMAGGADAVAAQAQTFLGAQRLGDALGLADMILTIQPDHKAALSVRRAVFQARLAKSQNTNEMGWLKAGIRDADQRLGD